MDNLINFLCSNWAVIVMLLCVLVVTFLQIFNFITLPTVEQKKKVLEWLLYAVTEAEKYFGSNMGAVKLRSVYDQFLTKFPSIAKAISFETFSSWVDEALESMKALMADNESIKNYAENKETEVTE